MQANWSKLVSKNFNEAAQNYNESASIQKEIALKLAKICSKHPIEPGVWVDLGSGTGLLANSLEALHPNQEVIRVDNCQQMINEQPDKCIKQLWDLNVGLPKWYRQPNLLASSFVLHWLDDPQQKLKEWINSLDPSGWIALAIPVKGSFPEWHEAASKAKVSCTAIDLPSYDSLREVITNKNVYFNEIEVIKQKADKVTSLLKPMIKVGAHSSNKKALSIKDWQHLVSNWPKSKEDEHITLTWLIQLLLIQK